MEIIVIGAVLALSFFTQGFVGFGGGLVGVPLMLSMGYSLPEAVQTVSIGGLVQSLYSTLKLRSEIHLKSIAPTMISRLIFLVLGLYVLFYLKDFDKVFIKQLVGIACLLVTLVITFFRPQRKDSASLSVNLLFGSISGFLLGSIGVGGPPLAIWTLLHNWTSERMRGSMFLISLPSYMVQIICNILVFNSEVTEISYKAALSFPIEVIGILLGMNLSKKISQRMARRIMLGVLIIMSSANILGY